MSSVASIPSARQDVQQRVNQRIEPLIQSAQLPDLIREPSNLAALVLNLGIQQVPVLNKPIMALLVIIDQIFQLLAKLARELC